MTEPVRPAVAPDLARLVGRRATLIGLGRRTHVALARYLVRHGVQVRISEARAADDLTAELALVRDLPLELRLGGHQAADVLDADVVFVSPGVSRELPVLAVAQERGIPISSEIELLFARCRAPIIGITGSAGKTTTTTMVGRMLTTGGMPAIVGGNIGVPLIEQIDDLPTATRVVLELSSYQLENLSQSPGLGAILNVTPNHLDRHPTFEHYRESKFNVLRYQRASDLAVLGADDPVAASLAPRCPAPVAWFSGQETVARGAYRAGNQLILRDPDGDVPFADARALRLPGAHNVLNVLAAATIAHAAGAGPAAVGAVAMDFPGVEHRLEYVRTVRGVDFFNDSIATSPERALAGLRAFSRPVVLIAGGRSKHLPLAELAAQIVAGARALVLLGEMVDEVTAAVRAQAGGDRVPIVVAKHLQDAVRLAQGYAQPGDAVVLSPAGTSFDQFRDFEDRGTQFKALVHALEDPG